MHRVTLELETLTATFVHADTDEARWRAAPFRGLARWWFRAIVGAACDPSELYRREAEVFGTAESPSPVTFRVFPISGGSPVEVDVNPGGQRSGRRKAFPAGSKLRLHIQTASRSTDASRFVKDANAALWAGLHLGGVGQRARRGGGSIRITSCEPDSSLGLPTSTDATQFAAELGRGLARARQQLRAERVRTVGPRPPFPVLDPKHAEIWVANRPWGPDELAVRRGLMDARRHCHRAVAQQAGPKPREFEFGGIGSEKERLSSPLWVRVASLGTSGALVVATVMRHAAADKLGAQWRYVDDFLTNLNGVRVGLE